MALIQRYGNFGIYWGDEQNSSHALNLIQMQINATYIYNYLIAQGWTVNAICGILGNMEWESSINPGRWEGDNVGIGPGYGLVQWTPFTNYTQWSGIVGDYSTMDNNLGRIMYELANNIQYYATTDYPLSFSQFTTSTQTPYYLACAFAWNYERSAIVISGTEQQKEALRQRRGSSANNWYAYLTGSPPPTPPTPTPVANKNKHFNFVLFNYRRTHGKR